jgi:hypothetical protein
MAIFKKQPKLFFVWLFFHQGLDSFVEPGFFSRGRVFLENFFLNRFVDGYNGFLQIFFGIFGVIAGQSFVSFFHSTPESSLNLTVFFRFLFGYPHILFGGFFDWHVRFAQVQNSKIKVQNDN